MRSLPAKLWRLFRSVLRSRLVRFAAGLVVVAVLVGALLLLLLWQSLPSIEEIDNRRISQSTKIYDREGTTLLYEISAGQKRTVVPLSEIPQALKDATIVTEDENFYSSPGFDWRAIVRAFLANIIHGRIVQGGSTITQQLAKKAFLSDEQTVTRKIRELLLSLQLVRRYTKDQILYLYLNEIPYGPTASGVEAASQAYFGKPVKDLGIAESALLAALPRAPSYYSPWGTHTKELFERERFILNKLSVSGKISAGELDGALRHEFSFRPRVEGIRAPHFVLAVQDYLIKKYGEDLVRLGGLTVKTTLDIKLQETAEKTVADGAARNEELYRGKNAALVAMDPQTGQVLALVGSRDYFDTANDGNFNVAMQGLRQPGSALKPFVYLTAFKMGYVPETVLLDAPTEFVPNNSSCPPTPDFTKQDDDCFHPQNFDERFRGPVSLRQGLGQSINIPAVKLLYLAGIENSLSTLRDFGVSTLTDPSRYGLSLVLGGGEIKLIELVGAYATLARDGMHHDQALILEVRDARGDVIESFHDVAIQVVDPQYPRLVNDILSDVQVRSGLFGGSLGLTTFPDHDVALKTGTTNNYRDAWAFGYTPTLVVGVWAGNNDNTPMQRHGSSILAAVPIWHDFMAEALVAQASVAFVKPERHIPEKTALGGSYLSDGQLHTILYSVDRDAPTGPSPINPTSDPQFLNWEAGVLSWALANIPGYQPGALVAPLSLGGQLFAQAPPTVTITEPRAGAFVGNAVPVSAQLISSAPITKIAILWNGSLVQSLLGNFPATYPFSFSFTPPGFLPQNVLEVLVENSDRFVGRSSVIVYR